MSKSSSLYVDGDSFFHRMDGAVKLVLLLVWTAVTFLFLDLRIFVVLLVAGISMLLVARIPIKRMKFLFWMLTLFTLMNSIFILLITPRFGSTLTGSNTPLIPLGYDTINVETLFYVLTLSLKYLTLCPITLLFIFTTHPSRFAASLNKLGVPYKMAYAVSIAFRYIPDLSQEFRHILNAMQMRGLGISRGDGNLKQRMRNLSLVVVPLLQSSLQHIESVSDAMDLRGFGTKPKRTWYMGTRAMRSDKIVVLLCVLLLTVGIVLKLQVVQGFWYPL
ncbi:energy-coupling factor transport system permease protein [Paenibacillus anaericanus]|uniref:Energy-coupling factor transporter transmembrane protein EcfT n=1 Tax=Paenibacillus anaericanus TaxID=170367 RepID=A0A3S1BHJ5_9BACL|nr:energy-coupling factor transporter transmembrane component T [Paenibacillus anaericanus]MDQ0089808.1 energy-coupling factor transport system permease protein [Paenibacillus anaericanus]RUT41774.1 energy-coupling factor transporter transmembrane protein EcfT [Paenibacillus anaericanus]